MSSPTSGVMRVALLFAVASLGLSIAWRAAFAQTATTPVNGAGTSQATSATPSSDSTTTMSVKVNVVNVLATVRDKHGAIVNNLTKDDFYLSEEGRAQTIRYFSKETDLPLTLGLLVDTSLSQRRVLGEERTASRAFLDQMLRVDKDKAFVIHFDRQVELLQDLTNSYDKLQAALDALQSPTLERTSTNDPNDSDPNGGRGSRRGGVGRGAGTLLYDSVYLASDELLKKQPGRKAVIVLSDGVDRGSKETLETAIETAQRADTVVYSILFKDDEGLGNRGGFGGGGGGPRIGLGGPMGGGGMGRRGGPGGYPRNEEHTDGKKILERISKETGGRMFEVSKKEPIDKIYAQIEEELRNQYSLGYTPDRSADNASGYRKIQLITKNSDQTVQTRDGYYAGQ